MGKHRILVVDDDQDILDLLEYNLEREGFKVMAVDQAAIALKTCIEFEPDLIILDIMMPEINGIELCKQIRALERFKDTVIFFLTARSEHYYHEAALETGGDDFIEKIMGLRGLTNKIKAVLTRSLVIRKREVLVKVGELSVNRKAGSVKVKDREIHLSGPEFELMYFFAQNPNRIFTSDNLLNQVCSSESLSTGTSVDVYVDLLMQKLGGHGLLKIEDGRYMLQQK